MISDEKHRALQRLHALMAHTVANGCTADEELSAARMAGRLAEEIMGGASIGLDMSYEPLRPEDRLKAERESPDYQAALENSTVEGLLKSAIQEMSMSHINTLSPPGRRLDGRQTQWLDVRQLLNAHLSMVLQVSNTRLARQILADTIEELVQDGMLPDRLAVLSEKSL
jgi:hypothetical protein